MVQDRCYRWRSQVRIPTPEYILIRLLFKHEYIYSLNGGLIILYYCILCPPVPSSVPDRVSKVDENWKFGASSALNAEKGALDGFLNWASPFLTKIYNQPVEVSSRSEVSNLATISSLRLNTFRLHILESADVSAPLANINSLFCSSHVQLRCPHAYNHTFDHNCCDHSSTCQNNPVV